MTVMYASTQAKRTQKACTSGLAVDKCTHKIGQHESNQIKSGKKGHKKTWSCLRIFQNTFRDLQRIVRFVKFCNFCPVLES